MMENYKIAIIILLALNGILVYVISRFGSYARECDSSNSERFSKLRKLCEHEAKAVDLYSTEVRRYAESENEFLNNLLEILKKNEKYYEDPEIIAIINKFAADYEKRVNNTNNLSFDILTNLKEIINEQED